MEKKRKVYPGFTLVELMVVLAIMGILTSIVAVSVFKQKDKASVKAAEISLKGIEQALILHQADNKQYPKTLQELVDKGTIKGQLKDPWGTKFNYSPLYSDDGSRVMKYILFSSGPDGIINTTDDIVSEDSATVE